MVRNRSTPLRIVLADPPLKDDYYAYYHPTMGILYLIGVLQSRFSPTDVDVHYLQGFETLDSHLKEIETLSPHIYGISFKTQVARLAFKTINAVKERFPQITVVAGGAHPSAMPEDVLRNSATDACFIGECENSFVKAVESAANGKIRFEEIPGIVFQENGALVSNPVGPLIGNLDTIPLPAWETIDFKRFTGMPYMKRHPYVGVTVSRGCPYKCTFCSEPVWRRDGKPSFRARSTRSIAEEIRYLYERGAREIRLWCEELNADPVWAEDMLKQVGDLELHDLLFSCNIRGDKMPVGLADAMRYANVWMVNMGMESASNRTLSGINKQVTVEEIESCCRILAERGIKIMGYFQFFLAWEEDESLHWETEEDAKNTINWALNLHKRGLLHFMGTTISTPRPASPLWDLAHKHDLMKAPPGTPFPYLAEGMKLPGVKSYQVKKTILRAYLAKARIGLRTAGINFRIIPEYAGHALRRLQRL